MSRISLDPGLPPVPFGLVEAVGVSATSLGEQGVATSIDGGVGGGTLQFRTSRGGVIGVTAACSELVGEGRLLRGSPRENAENDPAGLNGLCGVDSNVPDAGIPTVWRFRLVGWSVSRVSLHGLAFLGRVSFGDGT